MSELPPISGNPSPKTSGWAIWSLVLGILSFTSFSVSSAILAIICGHTALSHIKRSAGGLKGQGLAIGGFVTGYAGVVLAIVLPLIVAPKAHAKRNACINNLRQITAAKDQWALENSKQASELPTEKDLAPYLSHPFLKCPAGGEYKINAVGEQPTCSIPTHSLP